jgi:Sec-independent protein secretion pathway component TatC
MYMKMSFLTGLILAMPWVLYHLWIFVATGLYRHERRFVKLVLPTSLALFAAGVLFLYFLVLPIVLHFFIRFNESFGVTAMTPTGFESLLLPGAAPPNATAAPTAQDLPHVPIMTTDPPDAKPGDQWVNAATRRLVVKTDAGVLSVPMQSGKSISAMHSQFALDAYVSFVLTLALGFGLAFETPIVVFFLAWTGIVTAETMRNSRRYVILAVVIIGALLPPPDMFSQLLLAAPMYLLFEVGLLAARFAERPQ